MNSAFKIVLIILLSLITLALIGILTVLIMRGDKFDWSFNFSISEKLIEDKTINEVKDINIDVNIGDIIFEIGENDKVNVKLYSDHNESYSVKDSGDVIEVKYRESTGFRLFSKGPRAVITVPEDYDKNITIKGDVVDIKGKELSKATVKASFNVGDFKIDGLDKAIVSLTTGDIKMENVNSLTASSKTGDVKVTNVNGYINIDKNVGDVKIQNLYLTENCSIKNNIGDVKISKVNDIYIEAKTNIGDVKINGGDRKSDIVLSITNNTGDIKVG